MYRNLYNQSSPVFGILIICLDMCEAEKSKAEYASKVHSDLICEYHDILELVDMVGMAENFYV